MGFTGGAAERLPATSLGLLDNYQVPTVDHPAIHGNVITSPQTANAISCRCNRRIDAVDCVQDLLDYVAIRRISPTDTKNGRDVDAWWSSLPL